MLGISSALTTSLPVLKIILFTADLSRGSLPTPALASADKQRYDFVDRRAFS